jgi:hypothetical protein
VLRTRPRALGSLSTSGLWFSLGRPFLRHELGPRSPLRTAREQKQHGSPRTTIAHQSHRSSTLMSTVIDTSVIIDILRGLPAAVDYVGRLEDVPACSEITPVEVIPALRSAERVPVERLFG